MEFYSKYYIVTGGGLLEFAEDFRESHIKTRSAIWDYVVSIGGEAYKSSHSGSLFSVKFKADSDVTGFKKPDKDGFSGPYKKSKFYKEFQNLKMPCCMDGVREVTKCPTTLSYKADTGRGSSNIGNVFYPFQICWYAEKGPLLLVLPDVEKKANKIMDNHGFTEFEDDRHLWKFNKEWGREIIKEEWDFLAAKHKADNSNK